MVVLVSTAPVSADDPAGDLNAGIAELSVEELYESNLRFRLLRKPIAIPATSTHLPHSAYDWESAIWHSGRGYRSAAGSSIQSRTQPERQPQRTLRERQNGPDRIR